MVAAVSAAMGIRAARPTEMQATRLPLQLRPRNARGDTAAATVASVLGEKLALARIGVRGHVTVRCLEARLS